ncbi:MAG: sigma-54 dependent transcriptional regulator [Longimicrobiales bacterium]|nr:sigma-54 dependent transcriptional regulator [Longimicrobiales bacterium]
MTETLQGRILVVDDDRAFRLSTAELLRQDGHTVALAEDASAAAEALEGGRFDLVLLDLRMPGLDGLSLLEVLRKRGEGVPILMVTGFGSIETAVQSLHTGADDFLTKPVDPDILSARVGELLERRPGEVEERVPGMIGRAPSMREVFDGIRRVAPTDSTVLVTGETGTGKELVARAVHELSRRADRPFIPVNCAALAEGVLESELFGHVKGAFTGAVKDRKGLFAAADGGTILLDEVGDMSLRLQQRLLRVLQEKEVTPVGAVRATPVDARVIAATNRELRAEADAGRFREDLFYRLNVFQIRLPPLRARQGDIPLLIEAALDRVAARLPDGARPTVSPFAVRLLRSYGWPGNVRELMSVVESSVIRAEGGRVEAQHLPREIRDDDRDTDHGGGRYQCELSPAEEEAAIRAALDETGGKKTRAAEMLGMSRTTLWRKMKEYGI